MDKSAKKMDVPSALDTPTDLPQENVNKISAQLNGLLADAFALCLKTRNFHGHVSGRHFRDYHLPNSALLAALNAARGHGRSKSGVPTNAYDPRVHRSRGGQKVTRFFQEMDCRA